MDDAARMSVAISDAATCLPIKQQSDIDDRKRYYMDRQKDYVIRPHDSYRENYRDSRHSRYRRQDYDDYPTAHQRRLSRDRCSERPQVQRRVTDYPEAFHDAEFVQSSRVMDYARARPYDRDERRRFEPHSERPRREPAAYWR
jgi:hypothetical protein